MLILQDLEKRFGDIQALRGIAFEVRPGRIHGFLGPNGAGKTTAMRAILDIVPPDSGTVTWNGAPIDYNTRLAFGYMPEERGLYPRVIGVVAAIIVAKIATGSSSSPTTYNVGVSSESSTFDTAVGAIAGVGAITIELTPIAAAEADSKLRDSSIDAFVKAKTITVDKSLPADLGAALQEALRVSSAIDASGGADGPQVSKAITSPVSVQILNPSSQDATRTIVAYVGVIVLYMAILLYGMAIATSVMEEKSNRVVEVLMATVRPTSLLAGKVVGGGLAGLLQLGLTAVAAIVAGLVTGMLSFSDGAPASIGAVIIWFMIGYALYAALFAAAGALVDRPQDLQSVTTPLTLLLLVGFFVGIFSLNDPNQPFVVVLSFVPFFSPILVPLRAAAESIPAWQFWVPAALTAASIWFVIQIAARIYRGAVLESGRTPWRKALAKASDAGGRR